MPRWTASLRKLRVMPAADRAVLAQAAGALPLVTVGVKLAGIARLFGALEGMAGRAVAPPVDDCLPTVRRSARLVSLAARHSPFPGNCVSRSLTLWWLLRRRGILSDFRVGVRKDAGRLEAHAWIEYEGVVVNDRADVRQRYTAFTEGLHV